MFDRLGNLLSEALESGKIPQPEPQKPETSTGQPLRNQVFPTPSMPKAVKRSFDILGVAYSANLSECRSKYREKLKRFHPDSNSDNYIVQKVAAAKTAELVESWKKIATWFKESKKHST